MKLRGCIFRSLLPSRGLNTHFSPNLVRHCQKRDNSSFQQVSIIFNQESREFHKFSLLTKFKPRYFQYPSTKVEIPSPELDWNFITDPANFDKISKNIALRKSSADLKIVTELHRKYISQGGLHNDTDIFI